ncbi:hypothetical protein F5050DRAFT_1232530 [Lentinula boryana]|uniref:F-box domain-containing protein n=1 Tax=Lentinula boryana TaxID=40481 RepID=A0ABQ8QIQ8_9AGAR|nr:hypothetical protein F5050DRAFT_1232530 [Lentinula boryana]
MDNLEASFRSESLVAAPHIRQLVYSKHHDDVVNALSKLEKISKFDFPWQMKIARILHLLTCFRDLRHLVLYPTINDGPTEMPMVLPQLPPIDTFEVYMHDSSHLVDGNPLVVLTLPRLNFLRLVATVYIPEAFVILNAFFARSKCCLTALTIQGSFLSDKDLVSLLLRLPNLQNLHIEEECLTNPTKNPRLQPISTSFVKSLHTWERSHLRRSPGLFVPQLRCLAMKVKTKRFDASSFVETITSCWLPGCDGDRGCVLKVRRITSTRNR